jgi:hypothetical protein
MTILWPDLFCKPCSVQVTSDNESSVAYETLNLVRARINYGITTSEKTLKEAWFPSTYMWRQKSPKANTKTTTPSSGQRQPNTQGPTWSFENAEAQTKEIRPKPSQTSPR